MNQTEVICNLCASTFPISLDLSTTTTYTIQKNNQLVWTCSTCQELLREGRKF